MIGINKTMSVLIENGNFTFFNATDEHFSVKFNEKVPHWYESGRIQIPMYAIIFLLAVVGNSLVILTLVSDAFGVLKRVKTKLKYR